MSLENLGVAPCRVCGKPATYKKNGNGRVSCVCKWQDGGCGSQVQCIGPESSALLIGHVNKHKKPVKKEGKNETGSERKPDAQQGESKGSVFL